MNVYNNRVTAAFSAGDLTAITTALNNIDTLLVGVEGITAEERSKLSKINEANLVFVQDALVEMANPTAAAFTPAFLSAAAVQIDLTVYNQIEGILSRLDIVRSKLDNHRTLAGAEAYGATLLFYALAKAAMKAGVPGAEAIYEALKPRFEEQGGTPLGQTV